MYSERIHRKNPLEPSNWLPNCETVSVFTFQCATKMNAVVVIIVVPCRCIFWYEKFANFTNRLHRNRRLCRMSNFMQMHWSHCAQLSHIHTHTHTKPSWAKTRAQIDYYSSILFEVRKSRRFHSTIFPFIRMRQIYRHSGLLQCENHCVLVRFFPSSITFNIHFRKDSERK